MASQRELMTWECTGGRGRWVKRFQGKRYILGVRKLSALYPNLITDLSRAGTRRAANRWWLDQEENLKSASKDPAVEILHQIHEEFREFAVQLRDSAMVGVIDQRLNQTKRLLENGERVKGLSLRAPDGSEEHPSELLEVSSTDTAFRAQQMLRESLWQSLSRFDSVLPVHLPPVATEPAQDRSLQTILDRYLNDRKAETAPIDDIRVLSVGRYLEIRGHLKDFRRFMGEGASIDDVSQSETLTRYRTQLIEQVQKDESPVRRKRGKGGTFRAAAARPTKISCQTARARMVALKQFLKWCYEQEIIDRLPRNFQSKSLAIPLDRKEPKLFDLEQFRKILSAANDELKLYLLLMANCGFRQADIAALRIRELDLKAGRICHARVKTRKKKPPVVNYLLWAETLALLKQHLNSQKRELKADSLVFVSRTGGAVASKLLNGAGDGVRSSDAIKSSYWRVLQSLEITDAERRSLGVIRTTSANLLRKKFGLEIQTLFLGNKPQDVATIHYTSTHDDYRLDEPLMWLAGEYQISKVFDTKPG